MFDDIIGGIFDETINDINGVEETDEWDTGEEPEFWSTGQKADIWDTSEDVWAV